MEEKISKTELFKNSLKIYKEHALSISLVYASIFFVLYALFAASMQIKGEFSVLLAVKAVNFLVQSFAGFALVYISLKISEHKAPSWRDFASKINRFANFLITLVIFAVLANLGFAFFVVPGILAVLLLSLSIYASVDKNETFYKSIFFSLKSSAKNWTLLFYFLLGLFVLLFVLSFVGSLLPNILLGSFFFYLSLAVLIPLANIHMANIYKILSGQKFSKSGTKLSLKDATKKEKFFAAFVILLILIVALYAKTSDNTENRPAEKHAPSAIEFEKLRLSLELFKDAKGRAPESLFELQQASFAEGIDSAKFFYEKTGKEKYRLCTLGSDLCVESE